MFDVPAKPSQPMMSPTRMRSTISSKEEVVMVVEEEAEEEED